MSDKRFLDEAYKERDTGETREFYDRWAEVYDEEVDENAYQQPKRCADALTSQTGSTSGAILDIGCGTGLSGVALKEAGFSNIDGCDLSPGMLEKARRLGIYRDLFECDLNSPPMPRDDNSYDGITAVGVFSFGHVQAEALEEFCRIARKGAPIIIGLNDHFFQEGSLRKKINAMMSDGKLIRVDEVFGEHLPGIGLTGWVITLENRTG